MALDLMPGPVIVVLSVDYFSKKDIRDLWLQTFPFINFMGLLITHLQKIKLVFVNYQKSRVRTI